MWKIGQKLENLLDQPNCNFLWKLRNFQRKKIGKFPKIAKDQKFDLRLRVPRLKLRYLQSWWKLSEDMVEKSSIETVIYAKTTKNVMSAKNCNICVNPFWNPIYESFRNLPWKENILGGAPLLREIGNLLMQENLVMTSAYTRMSVWTGREVLSWPSCFSWLNINQFTCKRPVEAM